MAAWLFIFETFLPSCSYRKMKLFSMTSIKWKCSFFLSYNKSRESLESRSDGTIGKVTATSLDNRLELHSFYSHSIMVVGGPPLLVGRKTQRSRALMAISCKDWLKLEALAMYYFSYIKIMVTIFLFPRTPI